MTTTKTKHTLSRSNKFHEAIVLGAMLAADSFGVSRLRTCKEQLQLNDISFDEIELESMVFDLHSKAEGTL